MRGLASVKYVEQRSRFFAHLYEIDSPEDADEILKSHRRLYKKANHHCWAMRLGSEEKAKDDGEVGHPGKVLLEILKKHNLESHALVVSRVFGGVKLGVGGVSRAFKGAGEGAVQAFEVESRNFKQ
ncbi:MAG: YigZ family protein [Candidatus Thermoplasmatota archaeon]|nr:YigZ family protein [Euryarchaeota archaeon]MBU4032323.1 YigZ family protein [Candidatus Thermoplasmatota archaeon]MBU4070928.1 YigZ family protein [Candidatus Thermoplasmatota archaeon]MBU4144314.1 YigZ family protein [Candidatus Thermoplasmatota archaeon]MBU4592596.1 YigZ family protein [Candidatus Thermoplasmatota archaeon]